MSAPEVEVLLPVYNEGQSIEATIREICDELSLRLNVGLIICEDGSRDNTKGLAGRGMARARGGRRLSARVLPV